MISRLHRYLEANPSRPEIQGRFFFAASPLLGLLETWILGILLIWFFWRISLESNRFALTNSVLLLCGLCGIWAVLRLRLPAGNVLAQIFMEIARSIAVSMIMTLGLYLPALILGWVAIWNSTAWGFTGVMALLALTGPGYLISRIIVRFWWIWNRMRRRHMIWSITHALLVAFSLVFASGWLALLLFNSNFTGRVLSADSLPSFLANFFTTLFPASGVIIILTLAGIAILLPPAAFFSYWIARQTTRRLVSLAEAAGALRRGDYRARVVIKGQDEVAQLQQDFNAMADELERTLKELQAERDKVAALLENQRQLTAGVSHELRTPVAIVQGYLEPLQSKLDRATPAELKNDLGVIEAEILRLSRLIDDLFTLSQAEVGKLDLQLRSVPVKPVVERLVSTFAPLAWQRGRIDLAVEIERDPGNAWVDEGRLEQVLANLIRNALRHTPPGGIIAVASRPVEDGVYIEVRDTGEGIPPEELPFVWQRYYRGQSGQNLDRQGAGLGLALVKELVEAMSGRVTVESLPGQGSCFTLWLPRPRD